MDALLSRLAALESAQQRSPATAPAPQMLERITELEQQLASVAADQAVLQNSHTALTSRNELFKATQSQRLASQDLPAFSGGLGSFDERVAAALEVLGFGPQHMDLLARHSEDIAAVMQQGAAMQQDMHLVHGTVLALETKLAGLVESVAAVQQQQSGNQAHYANLESSILEHVSELQLQIVGVTEQMVERRDELSDASSHEPSWQAAIQRDTAERHQQVSAAIDGIHSLCNVTAKKVQLVEETVKAVEGKLTLVTAGAGLDPDVGKRSMQHDEHALPVHVLEQQEQLVLDVCSLQADVSAMSANMMAVKVSMERMADTRAAHSSAEREVQGGPTHAAGLRQLEAVVATLECKVNAMIGDAATVKESSSAAASARGVLGSGVSAEEHMLMALDLTKLERKVNVIIDDLAAIKNSLEELAAPVDAPVALDSANITPEEQMQIVLDLSKLERKVNIIINDLGELKDSCSVSSDILPGSSSTLERLTFAESEQQEVWIPASLWDVQSLGAEYRKCMKFTPDAFQSAIDASA
jgi:hypothetical protein